MNVVIGSVPVNLVLRSTENEDLILFTVDIDAAPYDFLLYMCDGKPVLHLWPEGEGDDTAKPTKVTFDVPWHFMHFVRAETKTIWVFFCRHPTLSNSSQVWPPPQEQE